MLTNAVFAPKSVFFASKSVFFVSFSLFGMLVDDSIELYLWIYSLGTTLFTKETL